MSISVPQEAIIYRASGDGLKAPIYMDVCQAGSCSRVELGEDFTVSRRLPERRGHARIYMEGGRVYVEDLGSKNGTIIDGRVIRSAREQVSPGQIVRIGYNIVFSIDTDPSRTTIPRGTLKYIDEGEYERLKSRGVSLEEVARSRGKVLVRFTGERPDPEYRYIDSEDSKIQYNISAYVLVLDDAEKMLGGRRDREAIDLLKPLVNQRDFMRLDVIVNREMLEEFTSNLRIVESIIGSSSFLPDDVRADLLRRISSLKRAIVMGLNRGWR